MTPRCLTIASPCLAGQLLSSVKGREVMVTFLIVYNSVLLISFLQETQAPTDFDDLGKLLLGGFAAAIVFALGFTFVRLRLRERSPQTSDFISISAPHEKKENVGR